MRKCKINLLNWTGEHLQVTVMCIPPGGEMGYAPPKHPKETIHKTKLDADLAGD